MRDYSDVPFKCPEISLMGEPSIEKKKKTDILEMFSKKKDKVYNESFCASKIYLW